LAASAWRKEKVSERSDQISKRKNEEEEKQRQIKTKTTSKPWQH
jgi:hypothetical protein